MANKQLLGQAVIHVITATEGSGLSLDSIGHEILQLADRNKSYAPLATLSHTEEGHLTGHGNFTLGDLEDVLRDLITKKRLFTFRPICLPSYPIIMYTHIQPR